MSAPTAFTRIAVTLLLISYCGSVTEAGGKLYWRESDVISRADLDGSDVETVLTGLNNSGGFAVGGGKLYWADPSDQAIRCAELDGSNVETLVTTEDPPLSLALDLDGGRLYWVESVPPAQTPDKIRRANLDGSQIENVVAGVTNADAIFDVELDVVNGWIYFTDFFYGLWRARIDGAPFVERLPVQHDLAVGIALDVPNDRVYFGNYDWCIIYSSLDGSEWGCKFNPPGSATFVAIDLGARDLYWVDGNYGSGIWRQSLDGGRPSNVVPDVGANTWIEIVRLCGNGVVDEGEECDDGNTEPGDGCEPDCTVPRPVPAASPAALLVAMLLMGGLVTFSIVRRRSV